MLDGVLFRGDFRDKPLDFLDLTRFRRLEKAQDQRIPEGFDNDPLQFPGGRAATSPQASAPFDAEAGGSTEAAIADRIAREEFGLPLRWREDRSRDTRENAAASVRLLRAAGVRRIVLVTHAWHMPRALRAFQEADPDLPVSPAPVNPVRPEEWER